MQEKKTFIKKATLSDEDKSFYKGFAVAISTLLKCYDEVTVAENVMRENGITVVDFKKAGVDKFDLDIIKKQCRAL